MYSYYAFYFFLALADASSGKKTLGKINDKLKFGISFMRWSVMIHFLAIICDQISCHFLSMFCFNFNSCYL